MRKTLIFTIFIIFFIGCNSQTNNSENTDGYRKIIISDVPIVKYPLEEVSYFDALHNFTSAKIEAYPQTEKNTKLVSTRVHPVIGAMHYGFAQHRPVAISPDMIWLMIMQGFAKHVSFMSDSLRTKMINFNGQKTISIRHDEFKRGNQKNEWNKVFPEFREQMKTSLNPELDTLMMISFSTTTEKEIIANQITMMSALSKFYRFNVQTACGIPYVILEGTPEDWKKIYENTKKLKKYDLDFWIDPLLPILNKIYLSSKGKNNKLFWKSMYKWNTSSGGDRVTGWIIKFFPYLETYNGAKVINRYLIRDYRKDARSERDFYYGMSGSSFTSGMSVCNFTWNYYQTDIEMQFFGGFVGVKQDENFVLRPEINWFVAERTDSLGRKPVSVNNDDFYNYYENNASEIDLIRPCRGRYDSLFYERCDKPDSLPIFNPEKNDNFKDGWNEFLSYVDFIYKEDISGKVKIVFYVDSKGNSRFVSSNAKTKELKEAAKSLFYHIEKKWKPATKDGEIVITEMELEVDFGK